MEEKTNACYVGRDRITCEVDVEGTKRQIEVPKETLKLFFKPPKEVIIRRIVEGEDMKGEATDIYENLNSKYSWEDTGKTKEEEMKDVSIGYR